jgi:hypothetical protein
LQTLLLVRQLKQTAIHTGKLSLSGMAEKAKEFAATGSEIYHGNLAEGAKEHH